MNRDRIGPVRNDPVKQAYRRFGLLAREARRDLANGDHRPLCLYSFPNYSDGSLRTGVNEETLHRNRPFSRPDVCFVQRATPECWGGLLTWTESGFNGSPRQMFAVRTEPTPYRGLEKTQSEGAA